MLKRKPAVASIFLPLLALLSGCGSGPVGDLTSAASCGSSCSSQVSGNYQGPSTTGGMPQVLDLGGRILTHPAFKAITFSGDTLSAQLDQFHRAFAASTEWSDMVSEYGVGAATAATSVALTESAPATITDSAIQSWLSAKLAAASRPLGNPDIQTIYVIYYPTSTTITATGQKSCVDFDGYHSSYVDSASGIKISYAVIARCTGYTVDDETATASHELVETATDPDSDAWGAIYQDFAIWDTLSYGTELGDLCQDYLDSYYIPSDIGFQIQKAWSNKAAASGKNPCAPSTSSVYFNAQPELTDTVTYVDTNGSQTTQGVLIPVGKSKTITLDVYGNASGNLALSAYEQGGGTDLAFSFSQTSATVGSKVQLTITVKSQNATYKGEPFWIVASQNGVSHKWPVIVGN